MELRSFIPVSRSRAFLRTAAVAAFLHLLGCLALIFAQSAPGYQAPAKPQPKEESVEVKALRGQAPLKKIYDYLQVDYSTARHLPALPESEKRKQARGKGLRIGAVRSLPASLNAASDGKVYQVPDGDVRVMAVISKGALYTRIQFSKMTLPAGARVFVYSLENPDEYYGPYEGHGLTDSGTFWTPPAKGEGVVIEYFVPKTAAGSKSSPFKVSKIVHVYTDPLTPKVGGCHNDVTPPWIDTAKSVGRLDFVSGGGAIQCTGTLLADNVAASDIPYVLTANHCISTQSEAQSLRVYWNYNGPTDILPTCPANCTDGANLLVTGASSDFSFLQLTGMVPGGLFFSGWDAANFAGSAAAAGIHHPDGTHKRISFGNARQPSGGECGTTLQCLAVDWTSGATEEGSSGSGLWKGLPTDPGGAKLIGQLFGGPSFCGASASELKDFYGRFSVTYPNISSFLEGTNCVTSVSPTSQNFPDTGGSGSFNVTAPGGCSWTAVPSGSFINITSGAGGTGNGTVNFTVAANNGPQRSGTIVAGGQVFNITQSGGGACAPTPINFGQTVNGTLSLTDCPLDDGSFYDVYSFAGTAGQPVTIAMSSSEFDTYLFLNNPDGSNLAQDDDSGGPPPDGTNSLINITLPTTGTYTIWANSFAANKTGAYTLTLNTATPRTLTVASSNPNSSVSITVTPPDNGGLGNGTTQFTRTYYQGTTVTLTAPGTAGGNLFQKWQRDGVDWSSSVTTLVTMDTDRTMTAVYVPPADFTLTVASSNPSSGVNIGVSPNDTGGFGNGTTQFTRTYTQNTTVTLTAPSTAGGNIFQKWQRDGVDFSTNLSADVFMNSAHTMTAVYVAPGNFVLTVASTNPSSGVNIIVTPNDNGGQGDGTTQFTRTYSQNTTVFLTAPATAGSNTFDKWMLNGSNYAFTRSTSIIMGANATLTAVYIPAQGTVQFSASNFNVQEDSTTVTITVNRSGDLSAPATVEYFTSDATAIDRRDYITALGSVFFGNGENSKTFVVLINEDRYEEGNETFNLTLTNPAGVNLGAPSTATVTIIDDPTEPATNPNDDQQNFVEQNYHDFLNRQSDPGGLGFWTGQITQCGTNTGCLEVQRISVSGSFFLSIEFQETGYLVERMYKVAYGDATGTSLFNGMHQLPVPIIRFNEFLKDTQRIARGVVVLAPGWEQLLENNKQAYAREFVLTTRFINAFPVNMTPAQFVDQLNQRAGNVLDANERNTAINAFGGSANTLNDFARAQVVRQVAGDQNLYDAEYNRAFVLMQYFGYLRRNPNDAPEPSLDHTGFDFWLTKLNQFGGRFIDAEMVKAFLQSIEYRQRFGP